VGVPNNEDLVDEQDLGRQVHRNREAEARHTISNISVLCC
jgi:hypothetical protein